MQLQTLAWAQNPTELELDLYFLPPHRTWMSLVCGVFQIDGRGSWLVPQECSSKSHWLRSLSFVRAHWRTRRSSFFVSPSHRSAPLRPLRSTGIR